ncbi:MAG: hypothetical protein GF383_04475 [Candidatus Lokiarchaeota archaeon]|nr:hypothetical protein [Candidatus Lokiarchaeota archaeon]
MTGSNPSEFCYMIRKGQKCVKSLVSKKHLAYYECEKCIWRMKSNDPRYLKSMEKLFEMYGNTKWD